MGWWPASVPQVDEARSAELLAEALDELHVALLEGLGLLARHPDGGRSAPVAAERRRQLGAAAARLRRAERLVAEFRTEPLLPT